MQEKVEILVDHGGKLLYCLMPVYGSNQEAAAALGIQPGSFGRLHRRPIT